MERSILYVSRKRLVADTDDGVEIKNIVAFSELRNARLGVTGALVATPTGFAQHLEGEQHALHQLMNSIGRDPRHTDVTVLDYKQITKRRFARWAMAYAQPNSGTVGLVDGILQDHWASGAQQSERLIRAMEAFGAQMAGSLADI